MQYPTIAIYFAQISVSAFLAILFLQSGLDKIVDRRGNLEWLTGHFAKSALAKMVPLLLITITLLELAAGACSAIGCLLIGLHRSEPPVAFWGAVLATASLLALFFGQRMAKDYAGAAVLVPYFLVAVLALFLLGPTVL